MFNNNSNDNHSPRPMFHQIKNILKMHRAVAMLLVAPIIINSGVVLMHVVRDKFGRGAHVAVCCLLLTAIAAFVAMANRWLPVEFANDKTAMRHVAAFGVPFTMIIALFGTWGVYECITHESYASALVAGLVMINLRLHTEAMQTFNSTTSATK